MKERVDMTPGAISGRVALACAGRVSSKLAGPQTDMSPEAVTSRLREVTALRRACLALAPT